MDGSSAVRQQELEFDEAQGPDGGERPESLTAGKRSRR